MTFSNQRMGYCRHLPALPFKLPQRWQGRTQKTTVYHLIHHVLPPITLLSLLK